MAEQPGLALTATSSIDKWLRRVWLALFAFNAVMVIVTVPPLLRGAVDSYHNEHARLVVGFLSGLLLTSGPLVRAPFRWMLLVAAFLSVGFSFFLAFH